MEWLTDPSWSGISGIVAVIGLMAGAVEWIRRRKRQKVDDEITQPKSDVHALAARFIELFRSHGIERTQIARFLGPDSGITLADLSDDERLIAKLDDGLLATVCERFGVRREWLEGTSKQIYPLHNFYKHPEEFLKFVECLRGNNSGDRIMGVLLSPTDDGAALIILQETIGYVGEKEIYRYHLCNRWAFTYWKARAYLTACIAIAWKRKVYIHGISEPKALIDHLAYGETLLGWQGEGIWALGHMTWHPEDMTLQPEVFLEGIDPEQDNFGIKSGLELWLDLDEQGLMDSGFGVNARQVFQQERAKY